MGFERRVEVQVGRSWVTTGGESEAFAEMGLERRGGDICAPPPVVRDQLLYA